VSHLLLSFDLGTTAGKTCLYEVGERLQLRSATSRPLPLHTAPDGAAEQDPRDWWSALASSVPEVLAAAGAGPRDVSALTFCAQMQCVVLVDRSGAPVRPALSYMDQRPTARKRALTRGGPRVAGIGAALALPWLRTAGGVAASAKDPLWKYLRIADEEPDAYARVHAWLDAKDYLTARCTGRFTMSADSAYATFLADTRGGRCAWSPWLVERFGVRPEHLPHVVGLGELVGDLTSPAAADLGLTAGTPVFAGGGDASLIGVGAGATGVGATHVYVGTSGWVSTVSDRRIVDTRSMMATVPGAVPGRYNYFGEQETSGKCLEWVRDHLALDEVGVYLVTTERPSGAHEEFSSLVDYLTATIAEVPAGSGGVLFAPWLHGSRSPFEDPYVRGLFLNLGLDTGKRQMIRAVVEGIAYNKRLLLEAQSRKVRPSHVLRFAGGGAVSDATSQVLADVTGHPVEAVVDPQYAGAAGAALVAAWGSGWFPTLDAAAATVPVRARFEPDPAVRAVHDRNYAVFANLYPATKDLFRRLNG
jgi:xylulokinase